MDRPNLLTSMRSAIRMLVATVLIGASVNVVSRAVIIDSDTVAFGKERIRIENIDAPESFRSRCERELVAGLKAKELHRIIDL